MGDPVIASPSPQPVPASVTPAPRARGRFPIPLHPFLFAAYPVLYLYGQNVGEVNLGDVLVPLIVVEAITAIALAVLSLIYRDARRAGILVSVALVTVLLFGQAIELMGRYAVHRHAWVLVVVVLALIVAAVVAWRIRGRLGTVTTAMNAIAGVLVLIAVIGVVPDVLQGVNGATVTSNRLPITATGPGTTRDIYYIILDRYGSERSIGSRYGITDNDFDTWLQEHGFQVLRDAHANYVSTTLSLAATLNLEFLDTLIPQKGPRPSDFQGIFDLLSDNRVGRFLKSQGYEYVQLGGWFGPTRTARVADVELHPNVLPDFSAALWDFSALPEAAQALGLMTTSGERDRAREAAIYQWDELPKVADRAGPTFTFAHILMPHPPYVFEADGTFVDGSTPGQKATYATQLKYTNSRMEQIVEPLLALPEEERPIIIIQADEGPYPLRNNAIRAANWADATTDEVEQKFGILSAFYLPGDPDAADPLPATLSSVNTFRTVLDRYFGADLPLLPDRSWASRKGKPYDFIEVTDRLPSLARSPEPVGASPSPTP